MSVALFVSLVSMKPSEYSRLFKKVNSPFKHTHGRLTVRENRYTPKHLVHRHSRNRTVSIYFIVLQREQTVTLSSYSAPKRKKKKKKEMCRLYYHVFVILPPFCPSEFLHSLLPLRHSFLLPPLPSIHITFILFCFFFLFFFF